MLLSGKFHCFFYLCLKSIQCVYRKLILQLVDDENDLHRGYVAVDCNILILYKIVGIVLHLLTIQNIGVISVKDTPKIFL